MTNLYIMASEQLYSTELSKERYASLNSTVSISIYFLQQVKNIQSSIGFYLTNQSMISLYLIQYNCVQYQSKMPHTVSSSLWQWQASENSNSTINLIPENQYLWQNQFQWHEILAQTCCACTFSLLQYSILTRMLKTLTLTF